jgi:hypothetical protein
VNLRGILEESTSAIDECKNRSGQCECTERVHRVTEGAVYRCLFYLRNDKYEVKLEQTIGERRLVFSEFMEYMRMETFGSRLCCSALAVQTDHHTRRSIT